MAAGRNGAMFCCTPQDHELAHVLDRQLVLRAAPALESEGPAVVKDVSIRNVDRSVGGILSFEVTRRFGAKGLGKENSIHVKFRGSSGQSFGNFLAPGITFELEGDANDYIGKGLSGGCLVAYKAADAPFKGHEAILAGNAALYGATAGRSFMAGIAAERF